MAATPPTFIGNSALNAKPKHPLFIENQRTRGKVNDQIETLGRLANRAAINQFAKADYHRAWADLLDMRPPIYPGDAERQATHAAELRRIADDIDARSIR